MSSEGKRTLQDYFKWSAINFPSQVAVTFDDGESEGHTTYQDLACTATEISSFLQALCEDEASVAVYANQNTAFVAAVLGVLQLSCAFAPIGTDWPPRTSHEFVRRLGITSVLVEVELLDAFQQHVLAWKSTMAKGSRFKFYENDLLTRNGFVLLKIASVELAVKREGAVPLAYVMQTSGTTGEPKTVKVPHSCIIPNINHLRSVFQVTQDDAVSLIAPNTFDPFVVQMFLALSSGARLVLVPEHLKKIPSALCKILFDRQRVTVFQPTPSLMHHIGDSLIKSKVLGPSSPLRVLAFGGEHCPSLPVLRQWTRTECPTELYNLYGITEVSCWASCYHITKAELHRTVAGCERQTPQIDITGVDLGFSQLGSLRDNVPIGSPLHDTVVEVRDGKGKTVKDGLGQIYIGGAGRVCFLDNETDVTQVTLRATGDWAFVEDGTVWYCGRTDRQIKRNGKRVNLDWVERTVSDALGFPCSLITGEGSYGNLRALYLFVATENDNRSFHEFRSNLRKDVGDLLPDCAQPDATFLVSTFPVTSHGKVDKAALLDSVRFRLDEREVPVKRFLKEAWAVALGLRDSNLFYQPDRSPYEPASTARKRPTSERGCKTPDEIEISEADRFVVCGGSSLAAVRLANVLESRMRETRYPSLQASDLVDVILNRTFGDLRAYVESKMTTGGDDKSLPSENPEVLHGNFAPAVSGSRDAHALRMTGSYCDEKMATLRGGGRRDPGGRFLCSDLGVPGLLTHGASVECGEGASPKRTKFSELKRDATQLCPENARDAGCYCSVRRGMQRTTCLPCQNRCSEELADSVDARVVNSRGTGVVKVTEKWKTCLYKCIDASPLVVTSSNRQDGEVYVGSHGHVFMAVRLSDGHVIWEREVGGRVESSAVLSACGTYVIVGCYDGKLYVFERLTGALVWAPRTDGPIKSSPAVDPRTERVWVGSHDHFLYSFDVTNRQRACAVHCGGGACFSSPRVSREPHVIYTSTLSGVVTALDPYEHSIIWRQRCPKAVFTSPLVFSGGVLCACVDGTAYTFSHQGDALWTYQTQDAIFSTPALVESSNPSNSLILLGSHDCHVYCLNTRGHVIWSFCTDAQVYCTPFVTCAPRDHSPPDGQVYVFSTVGALYILDLTSGSLLATTSLPGEVFSSPVVAADQIVVGCRNDFLYSLTVQ